MCPEIGFGVPPSKELQAVARVPAEIIHHILRFLSPLEIIRIQRVSKQFHAIGNDTIMWRTLYEKAQLPRPPGPFPWQSTLFLQRTLVHSAQLAKSWTSQPVKVISGRKFFLGRKSLDDHQWVNARWLISITTTTQIVSHDIDSSSQQTLWDSGPISWWTAGSIVSAHGHLIYTLLRTTEGDNQDAVKLIGFLVNDDSGQLSRSFSSDVPTRHVHGNLNLRVECASSARFLCIFTDEADTLEGALIFDIGSQIFYRFPRFRSELCPSVLFRNPMQISLTTTHILVHNFHRDVRMGRLIQAFVVPDNLHQDKDGFYQLRLTHETTMDGLRFHSLIPTSMVDPLTKATIIRSMHAVTLQGPTPSALPLFRFMCVDLTLPEPGTNGVKPISVDTHEIFTCEGILGKVCIETSSDGFVRGFCMVGSISASRNSVCYRVRKFTIDASGDKCSAVVGEPSSPWLGHKCVNWSISSFDGVRGRVCYPEGSNFFGGESEFTFAIDFK